MNIRKFIREVLEENFGGNLNDNFWKWFSGSKVVDGSGNPLVVHHGTGKKFSKFNLKKGTQQLIWFTSNKSAIESGDVGAQGKGHIMDLYASIKNPASWSEYEKYGLGQLHSLGYDGAILPDPDGTITGFVFEPTQLKSVANKGEWNASDKNIFKEERELGKSLASQMQTPYITIYRACPMDANEFLDMDYITLSKKFAIEHSENNHIYYDKPFHVIQALVSTSEVYDATNPGEYFYHKKNGESKKGKEIYVTKGDDFEGLYESKKEVSSTYSIDDNFYLYKDDKRIYCSNSKSDLINYLKHNSPELLKKFNLDVPKEKEYSGVITLYRGHAYNEGNNFYSPSKEFALEFTRTGRESELTKIKVNSNRIYKHNPLPRGYGIEDKNFDLAIEIAKSKGMNAIWVDEGIDQPNSVFAIEPKKGINEELNHNNSNIYYHASNKKFDEFDLTNNKTYKEFDIPSWFFTKDINYAKTYGKYLYTVNLTVKNTFNTENPVHYKMFLSQLKELGYKKSEIENILDEQFYNGIPYWTCEDAFYTAKMNGFDSILIQEELTSEVLSVAVFDVDDIEILKITS